LLVAFIGFQAGNFNTAGRLLFTDEHRQTGIGKNLYFIGGLKKKLSADP